MPDYEEIITKSLTNVKDLAEKLNDLEGLLQDIRAVKESGKVIPELFEKKFQEVRGLTADYTNTLGVVTKMYLDGNNALFTGNLGVLADKLSAFEAEITRLKNTDLTRLFQDLQESFIEQTRSDLATELQQFSDKTRELQARIDELKREADRFQQIDLEKSFDKLQKTLSDIFGTINAVNVTLANLIQTLAGMSRAVATVQTTLEINQKEVARLLQVFSDSTEEHLVRQDKEAAKAIELLESKIQSVVAQNELLKREVKANRVLMIALLLLGIAATAFFALRR